MKLSIITVSLNNAATIDATIRSVLSQTWHNLEYLIIDGGSTDGTLEVIAPYRSRLAGVVSEPDTGIYDAMNKGIERATGDVIGILNADDCYADRQVVADVAACFDDPGIDACYGDLVYVSASLPERVVRYWQAGRVNRARLRAGWVPPHPSFFLRTSCYRSYGNYKTCFRIAGDYELLVRMLNRYSVTCHYLPRVLVRMRTGGISNRSLASIFQANREAWQAWSSNGLYLSPFRFLGKPFSKLRQYLVRPL